MGDVEGAFALQADIEAFLLCQIPRKIGAGPQILEEAAGLFQAVAGDQFADAELGRRVAQKPAIAARGTPGNRPGFEHHGLDAVVAGEMVGGGKPGIAAADNGDVAGEIGRKLRKVEARRARFPIGGLEGAGVVEGGVEDRRVHRQSVRRWRSRPP